MQFKKYQFKDNDFEMDINVSIEERTIYMNQKEMSIFLEISNGSLSKIIKKMSYKSKGIVSKVSENGNHGRIYYATYYALEIIKEIGEKYNKDRIIKLEKWLSDLLEKQSPSLLDNNYEIVRYSQDNLDIPVRIERELETIWLTTKEIAMVFDTTEENVYYHMANIFDDQELQRDSISKDSLVVGYNGKNYKMSLYNLDMILAIGYRVRTAKAIKFRRWASEIIKKAVRLNNTSYIETIKSLELLMVNKIEKHDERIAKLEDLIQELRPKNILFYKNNSYNAYTFLSGLFLTVRSALLYIDPYVDRFTISLFMVIKDDVYILIVTSKSNDIPNEQIELIKRIKPNLKLEIIIDNDEHDRQIIIDQKYGFFLGSSINSLGYYDYHISTIEDKKYIKDIIDKYKKISLKRD